MKNKVTSKIVSWLLMFAMIFTATPISAFADDAILAEQPTVVAAEGEAAPEISADNTVLPDDTKLEEADESTAPEEDNVLSSEENVIQPLDEQPAKAPVIRVKAALKQGNTTVPVPEDATVYFYSDYPTYWKTPDSNDRLTMEYSVSKDIPIYRQPNIRVAKYNMADYTFLGWQVGDKIIKNNTGEIHTDITDYFTAAGYEVPSEANKLGARVLSDLIVGSTMDFMLYDAEQNAQDMTLTALFEKRSQSARLMWFDEEGPIYLKKSNNYNDNISLHLNINEDISSKTVNIHGALENLSNPEDTRAISTKYTRDDQTFSFLPRNVCKANISAHIANGTEIEGVDTTSITGDPVLVYVLDPSLDKTSIVTSSNPAEPLVLTYTLNHPWTETDDTIPEIIWTSSDENVLTVTTAAAENAEGKLTQQGTLEIKGEGEATVTVTVGTISVSSQVTVSDMTGITLTQESLKANLDTAKTAVLTANIEGGVKPVVRWESNNPDVAAVASATGVNNTLTFTHPGVADITATIKTLDGEKTATCKVLVTNNKIEAAKDGEVSSFWSVLNRQYAHENPVSNELYRYQVETPAGFAKAFQDPNNYYKYDSTGLNDSAGYTTFFDAGLDLDTTVHNGLVYNSIIENDQVRNLYIYLADDRTTSSVALINGMRVNAHKLDRIFVTPGDHIVLGNMPKDDVSGVRYAWLEYNNAQAENEYAVDKGAKMTFTVKGWNVSDGSDAQTAAALSNLPVRVYRNEIYRRGDDSTEIESMRTQTDANGRFTINFKDAGSYGIVVGDAAKDDNFSNLLPFPQVNVGVRSNSDAEIIELFAEASGRGTSSVLKQAYPEIAGSKLYYCQGNMDLRGFITPGATAVLDKGTTQEKTLPVDEKGYFIHSYFTAEEAGKADVYSQHYLHTLTVTSADGKVSNSIILLHAPINNTSPFPINYLTDDTGAQIPFGYGYTEPKSGYNPGEFNRYTVNGKEIALPAGRGSSLTSFITTQDMASINLYGEQTKNGYTLSLEMEGAKIARINPDGTLGEWIEGSVSEDYKSFNINNVPLEPGANWFVRQMKRHSDGVWLDTGIIVVYRTDAKQQEVTITPADLQITDSYGDIYKFENTNQTTEYGGYPIWRVILPGGEEQTLADLKVVNKPKDAILSFYDVRFEHIFENEDTEAGTVKIKLHPTNIPSQVYLNTTRQMQVQLNGTNGISFAYY